MTQSPHNGPTAPRTTDFGAPSGGSGSTATAAAGNAHDASTVPRAQDPAFGAPVHADAPTGTIPPLVTGNAAQQPGASSPGSGVAASAPTTQTPPARGTSAPVRPPGQPPRTAGNQSRSTTTSRSARSRGPRRARLQLRNINPSTVLKFSCVLSVALFFVWLIVVGVLFGILDAAGIIGKVNDTIVTLNGPGSEAPITAGVVFGGAAIIGVVNIVLFIALSTVGSVVYNLCADLVGGIEVTLSET